MGKVQDAVNWAVQTANDPGHGYSQVDRWGPDYDCSSYVITAYEQAGVPVREAGASFTGNMRGAFLTCGFEDVTGQVNLNTGYGMQAGDVLLNYASHTCLHIGSGRVANCRTDEGHPQAGDQGQEIRVQGYWNFPWNCCLRYTGGESSVRPVDPPAQQSRVNLKKGMSGVDVKDLQLRLNQLGYDCGEADGIFGARTFRAVLMFQEDHGLDADGIAGRMTNEAIKAALGKKEEDAGDKYWLPELVLGSRGPAVEFLQMALTLRGRPCTVNGVYGPETLEAVNNFKIGIKQPIDGKVDRPVWEALLGVT